MTRPAIGAIAVCVLLASPLGAEVAGGRVGQAGALPGGAGREEVEIYCSACHSLKIVTQQGLSRTDWDELLDWMVEEQGMEEMPPGDRKIVLDYLARHISVERVRAMRRGR